MADYYTLLTDAGIAYETACKAAGVPIKLAHISVGDGNGAVYNPDASAKALKREVWRGPLNALFQDEKNASWLMAEVTIPSDVGGWYVREAGLWTDTGILYAVVKYPESYKPVLATSGSGKEFYIRSIFETSNASIVTLLIDDTVVKATRAWVMDYLKQGTYSKAEIEAMIAKASALPVGAILAFPVNKIPPGFLEIDGSVKSATVYPDLAAFLGGAFNKGDEGAGSFRLPETRGEFLRGWDHGRGVDVGRTLGSFQLDQMQGHFHAPPGTASQFFGNPPGIGSGLLSQGTGVVGFANTGVAVADGVNGVPRIGAETRSRNVSVIWCIKAWSTPTNQGNIDISSLIPFSTQATETNQGTAKVGTQDQVNSGLDDTAMLTSKKLRSAKSTCSAWVNWNGTGSVVVRDSYNVSSITDNGIGDFTINLATPMTNPNYSFSYTVGGIGSALNLCSGSAVAPTVSALRVLSVSALGMGTGANFQMTDFPINSVHIFGGK